jgi:hypothetical protein
LIAATTIAAPGRGRSAAAPGARSQGESTCVSGWVASFATSALPVDLGRRPLEQDGDEDALAELVARDLDRLGGLAARQDEDALDQAPLDPGAEQRQQRYRDGPDGQRGTRPRDCPARH